MGKKKNQTKKVEPKPAAAEEPKVEQEEAKVVVEEPKPEPKPEPKAEPKVEQEESKEGKKDGKLYHPDTGEEISKNELKRVLKAKAKAAEAEEKKKTKGPEPPAKVGGGKPKPKIEEEVDPSKYTDNRKKFI
jgi:hypothetical protein